MSGQPTDRPNEPHNPDDELEKLLQAVESNGPASPAWKILKALVTEQLDRDELQDCQVCNGTGRYMGKSGNNDSGDEIHWGMHGACSVCGGSGRIIVSRMKGR